MIEPSERSRQERLTRDALALLMLALVLLALLTYLFSGMHWTALSMPINLAKPGVVSGQFSANWGVPYQLRLDTERNLNLQQQYCLLGIETRPAGKCMDQASGLGLSWTVKQHKEAVIQSKLTATRVPYLGPHMGIVLDRFATLKGEIYTVALTVTDPSTRLQATHPRVVVSVAPEARMWTYVSEGLLVVFATFAIILAILLLLSAFDVFAPGSRRAPSR